MIQIGDVWALTPTQEEKYDADVTDQPAEEGSNFVDNVVNHAVVITRDCVISATPLGINRNAAFGPDIIAGCKARLLAIRAAREPIVVTELDATYPNMLIQSLTFTRSVKTGNALVFKITLKQLDVITNERTIIEVSIPRAQAKKDKGQKDAKAHPDPGPKDDIDPLRKVTNYISKKATGSNFISPNPRPGGGL